jgi:hypothetical protein
VYDSTAEEATRVYDSPAVQLRGHDATTNFERADDEVTVPTEVVERVSQPPKKDHNASSASSYDSRDDSASDAAAPTSVLHVFPPSATASSACNKSKKPAASPTLVLHAFMPSTSSTVL